MPILKHKPSHSQLADKDHCALPAMISCHIICIFSDPGPDGYSQRTMVRFHGGLHQEETNQTGQGARTFTVLGACLAQISGLLSHLEKRQTTNDARTINRHHTRLVLKNQGLLWKVMIL